MLTSSHDMSNSCRVKFSPIISSENSIRGSILLIVLAHTHSLSTDHSGTFTPSLRLTPGYPTITWNPTGMDPLRSGRLPYCRSELGCLSAFCLPPLLLSGGGSSSRPAQAASAIPSCLAAAGFLAAITTVPHGLAAASAAGGSGIEAFSSSIILAHTLLCCCCCISHIDILYLLFQNTPRRYRQV